MATKLVRKDNHDILIVSTRERVPGIAHISYARYGIDGALVIEYSGGTDIDWDGQVTATRDGERIFIDEEGEAVLESEIEIVEVSED